MHISVLLQEIIENLNLRETGIYVDATLGYAGHSGEILKRIIRGCLFAFDQDKVAISAATKKLEGIGKNFTIIKSNFINIKEELESRGITKVDGILFDLGVSSPQLDEMNRGFSYHNDAKLDMRMDQDGKFSAFELVNSYDEKRLADIIFKYGEEKYARSIAKNIVKYRKNKEIETTLELVEIIKNSMPVKARLDKHPARKTFQAIRIEVNKEIEILEISLKKALSILNINGRLAVITFHSLEDRIVKSLFKELTSVDQFVKGMPTIPEKYLPDYKLITTKAIAPTEEEIMNNPRSRSAKLRVIERTK